MLRETPCHRIVDARRGTPAGDSIGGNPTRGDTMRIRTGARMRAFAPLVALAATLCVAGPARAQDYPAKPIKFVVSSQAGGVVDIRARRLGARLAELVRQPIVVENRPGASTTIGAEYVAKSPPDGYTALFGGNNEMVAAALGFPIRYDPINGFAPAAQFSLGYPVMVVHSGMGIKSLPALIDWARERPGQLLCGTAGHGSGQHFICELLARSARIQLRTVPYKGTGPMLLDTASGQVHVSIGFLAEVDKQYIQTGKVVPIGALAPNRISRFPDLPTMTEMGHPGFEMMSWTGIFFPAGVPREAVARINAEITKIVREPAFSAWLAETGSEVVTPTPEQFTEFYRTQFARWKKMSDDFGIRAEGQ